MLDLSELRQCAAGNDFLCPVARLVHFYCALFKTGFCLPTCRSGRSLPVPASGRWTDLSGSGLTNLIKNNGGKRMTSNVSRRSLLALGAGLGATALLDGSALARAPKLGTQSPYWHRFILGGAEVTVVSDGPLPLGDPSGTFIGVPKEEVKKMLSDNFLSPDNVV